LQFFPDLFIWAKIDDFSSSHLLANFDDFAHCAYLPSMSLI